MDAQGLDVGVVRSAPVPVPTLPRAYLVRIVDSTSEPHQDDTRRDGRTGLGEGTMLFLTDDEGVVTAYEATRVGNMTWCAKCRQHWPDGFFNILI